MSEESKVDEILPTPSVTLASFGNLIPMEATTIEELEEEEELEKNKQKKQVEEDIIMNSSIDVSSFRALSLSTLESNLTSYMYQTPSTSTSAPIEIIPAKIITITSTSPSGLKTRDFLAKYYKPVSDSQLGVANRHFIDLPESYFSPTPSELQIAFAGQVRKREGLVDAPMLTKALRDKELAAKERTKANRWPQVSFTFLFVVVVFR